MYCYELISNNIFVIIAPVLFLSIAIVHIVFGFLIEVNEFNVYALFDSSPLFDFEIKNDCEDKTAVIFHKWGGRIVIETYSNPNPEGDDSERTSVEDETDIKKINENYFCYKHISYKDLLYNGQIIKKGSECPSEYPKNCGKFDTLEQELCIKVNENCPIYDLGIGKKPDDNYIYNDESNVYYNNNNYTKENKTIIGKLILNEGQPCYYSLEKLWRKFNPEEAVETHLKCDIEVYGKFNDDRYEKRGDISYKRLYEDNLNQKCKDMILKYLRGEEVSLYKREFLGIDKECDKNHIFTKDSFDSFISSQKSLKALLIAEGFIVLIAAVVEFIPLFFMHKCENDDPELSCIFYGIGLVPFIPCFICQIVFFCRIKYNDISDYNCSDSITNELIRIGSEANDKQFLYFTINFYLDVFLAGVNCLNILIVFASIIFGFEKCCKNLCKKSESYQNNDRELLARY